MRRTFEEALANRRSYYNINSDSSVSREEIVRILHEAVRYVPSAYNSQTTRLVLLLGENHLKLWDIVKEALQKEIAEEVFAKTRKKIDGSFASGQGTILFFEDASEVDRLMKSYPLYAGNFKIWSQHTNAMHQFVVWTMLEDLGLGASLQHYNPLIDEKVRYTWHLPQEWELIAQMPFGMPLSAPDVKTSKPLEERVKVFG